MAFTKARRDSSISHRQRPSITNLMAIEPLPPTVTPLPGFVLRPDSKHVLFRLSTISLAFASVARRFRIRSSMIALLTLLMLAVFCVLHQHLNDASSLTFSTPSRPSRYTNDHVRYRTSIARPPRPPKITLAPDEELAAVVAFMAALASNALPDSVDPMVTIDPDLILEFDTRTSDAAREVRELVDDTWTRLPIVLLSKRYSPISRELKAFLTEYNLKPSPVIFEIDERADEAVLTPLLYRLTAASDLPILLLGGQPLGSIETIRELHTSGQLRTMISATGAIIDGVKKKKKGRRAVH